VRILLTNDDGIESPGLHALAAAMGETAEVVVVAPQENQSAVARSITIRHALTVRASVVPGASAAFALTGTPVDCVRYARLGLEGFDMVVSGANIGHNLGDDVTYSGTVAAAFEAALLGLPAIAVSQGPASGGTGFVDSGDVYDFGPGARFVARLARRIQETRLADGTLLNVNVPHAPAGAAITTLGRRVYADQLEVVEDRGEERLVRIYTGTGHSHVDEKGTDFAAIERGLIAVTPLRFDLGMGAAAALEGLDVGDLL
jgi:5'-nucleotidase